MNVPKNLKYSSTDEWVKVDGNTATIGITDYAQSQLSDIVYVEITAGAGQKLAKSAALASVESVKAASDVNTPVSGKVVAVNDGLGKSPEVVMPAAYAFPAVSTAMEVASSSLVPPR